MKRLLYVLIFQSCQLFAQNMYSSRTPVFSPYVPQYDANLVLEASQRRQTRFDANVSAIKARIREIRSRIDILNELDPDRANKAAKMLNTFVSSLNTSEFDFSKSSDFDWVMENLDRAEFGVKKQIKAAEQNQ